MRKIKSRVGLKIITIIGLVALSLLFDSFVATEAQGGSNFDLSVSSNYGFRYDGSSQNSRVGYSIAVGDINGDGEDDLVIGEYFADFNSRTNSGSVYVIFSTKADDYFGTGNSIDLSSSNNYNLRFDGAGSYDKLGEAVAVGDVNGDGKGDLIMSAPGRNDLYPGEYYAGGSVYVVFSTLIDNYSGTGNIIDLKSLSNYNLRYDGGGSAYEMGVSLAVGDINEDGKSDLIIGDPNAYSRDQGLVYILFSTSIDNYSGTGNNIWLDRRRADLTFSSHIDYSHIGTSLAVGDVNEDNKGDLIIGAERGIYVLFSNRIVNTYNSSSGYVLPIESSYYNLYFFDGSSESGYGFGANVTVGDINKDNKGDLIVSDFSASRNSRNYSGSVYVIFSDKIVSFVTGGGYSNNINIGNSASYNLRFDGAGSYDDLGWGGLIVGDVDNDGKNDLVICAPGADYNSRGDSGSVYLISSNKLNLYSGNGNNVDLYNLSSYDKRYDGASAGDGLGGTWYAKGVSIGDINNDGKNDLILGATGTDYNGRSNSGSVYIIGEFELPPQISVTPSSLDFGDIEVGSTKDLNFTVKNTGSGTLSGSVTGLAAPFSCISGCSYNLSAGASQNVTIRFSPTSSGSFSDTAVFSGGGGASRGVSGTGTVISAPSVQTNSASSISENKATLNGNLSDLGGAGSCNVWFEWGTDTSYGHETTHNIKSSTGSFSDTITGLTPGITYHFRAVAENPGGIGYGSDRTFNTTIPTTCYPYGSQFDFISNVSNLGRIYVARLDSDDFLLSYFVVGVNNNRLRVAHLTGNQICFGPEYSAPVTGVVTALSSTRAVIKGSVVVDIDGYKISVGANTFNPGGGVIDSIAISPNKILVGYIYHPYFSLYEIRIRVAQITGSTISFGPEITLDSSNVPYPIPYYGSIIRMDALTSNRGLVAFRLATTAAIKIVEIDGTNISLIGPTTWQGRPEIELVRHFDIVTLDPNHFFFAYTTDYKAAGFVVNITPTLGFVAGSEKDFTSFSPSEIIDLSATKVDSQHALLAWLYGVTVYPTLTPVNSVAIVGSDIYYHYLNNPGSTKPSADYISISDINSSLFFWVATTRHSLITTTSDGTGLVSNIVWLPSLPTVTNNGGATNTTSNSATLRGEVTDTGGENPTVKIYWGNNDGGTDPSSWDNVLDLGTKPKGAFFEDISGLNPGTNYYYRCYASNSGGEDWADSSSSFTTSGLTPGTCQSHNTWGYAWSENIGWISFSCKNCDQDNNGYVDTNCGGDNSTVPSVDYGVDIDDNQSSSTYGQLSGYAWSSSIGWISFNESDLSGCPQAPCKAWVDTNTGNIYGWAKALSANDSNSGGWDGWIHLRGSNYGAKINFSASPAEFEDWAWGGDDNSNEANIGWISFNCNNSETGNVCSQSNYKVYTSVIFNSAPQVQNPHISSQDYCVAEQTGRIVFEWTYSDPDSDPETRFDLRINDINNVNDPNPEVDRTISGLNNSSPTTNNQSVFVVSSYQSDKLQYNKTYYWWVRLWDNQGNNSGWQYAGSFTTAHHAYPYVSFTWNPEEPTVEEVVQFTNQTKCYNINNNEVNCSSYLWTIPPTAEFANETNQFSKDPQIIFHETGNDIPVTLRATDPSGFSCEKTTNIQINAPLPGWTEVPPR